MVIAFTKWPLLSLFCAQHVFAPFCCCLIMPGSTNLLILHSMSGKTNITHLKDIYKGLMKLWRAGQEAASTSKAVLEPRTTTPPTTPTPPQEPRRRRRRRHCSSRRRRRRLRGQGRLLKQRCHQLQRRRREPGNHPTPAPAASPAAASPARAAASPACKAGKMPWSVKPKKQAKKKKK